VVVVALAASLAVSAPCLVSATVPCNRGKSVAQQMKSRCCCGANCKCGPSCGASKQPTNPQKQSSETQTQLQDLAKVQGSSLVSLAAQGAGAAHVGAEALNHPQFSSGQTLLAHHTCLRV
jgi:hypothetical protein